ncbi:MAG: hypothetical protein FJ267_12285, partial [Planctomycetes bacterium]|nr:hypothetical protein [Planctomycetota bacterium]
LVAARLVLQVTEATELTHAHQILHRDIKPGNILLAPLPQIENQTEKSGHLSQYIPKLADFGVAKLLQEDDLTATQSSIGTPAYMSPEQASGKVKEIDRRGDVYSLGAVFYELLTHRPVHSGENSFDVLRKVQQDAIRSPLSLVETIPLDAEAICLKCLQRQQTDRYQSAQELADDLRRFLDGRPVQARPLTPHQQLMRFASQNSAFAISIGITAIAVLSLLTISLWYNAQLRKSLATVNAHEQRLQEQTEDLTEKTAALRRRVYTDDMRRAATSFQEGQQNQTRSLLDAWQPVSGETDLRTFPWWMMHHRLEETSKVIATIPPGTTSASVVYVPDRDAFAIGEPDGVIRVRSMFDGSLIGELRGHAHGAINSLEYRQTPNGPRLLSAADDGTVRLWNSQSFEESLILETKQGQVRSARFLGTMAGHVVTGGLVV